jgi:CDP-diacylglycerol--glycerol-3-phosphate 3-phosphatidyltransferase
MAGQPFNKLCTKNSTAALTEPAYNILNPKRIVSLLNLPNLLALLRILMAPVMFWVILNPEYFTGNGIDITWNYYTASLLFVLASVTDFFDGFIARQLEQITMLGKILDPLADKMLIIAAFLGLMMAGDASVWAIYIIIVRELFITGLRAVAALLLGFVTDDLFEWRVLTPA